MKPQLFLTSVIRPGLAVLADASALRVQSPEAEVLLLAIATQESALRHRTQVGGPARGHWQFERAAASPASSATTARRRRCGHCAQR